MFCLSFNTISNAKLTVFGTVRNAATALTVDIANILLQARVGNAAVALSDRAVGVGALRHGSRESGDGEDNGGGGELHFCGIEIVCDIGGCMNNVLTCICQKVRNYRLCEDPTGGKDWL